MFRFFADINNISASSIKLNDDDSKHIRTLRLRPDEHFTVCDGNGTEYICKLGKPDKTATAEIISSYKSSAEPTVQCKVYIAFSKGDRLDYAVQKTVELGAHEITLFESERCVAVPHDIPKKTARLQRIALEAAKLCNRGIIPKVTSCGDFENMLTQATENTTLTLFLYESEENLHLKNVLQEHFAKASANEENTNSIAIITGPEGGFSQNEAELARTKNIPVVSMGKRILRSETAPVAALAVIMYQTDNM